MTAGVTREEPTIPTMDNPVNIKAPKRRVGIPIIKQMTAIILPILFKSNLSRIDCYITEPPTIKMAVISKNTANQRPARMWISRY